MKIQYTGVDKMLIHDGTLNTLEIVHKNDRTTE